MISQLLEHPPLWPTITRSILRFAWTFPLSFACYVSFLRHSFPTFFSKRMNIVTICAVALCMVSTLSVDLSPL